MDYAGRQPEEIDGRGMTMQGSRSVRVQEAVGTSLGESVAGIRWSLRRLMMVDAPRRRDAVPGLPSQS